MKRYMYSGGLLSPYFIAAQIDNNSKSVIIASYKTPIDPALDVKEEWGFGKLLCRSPDGFKQLELVSHVSLDLSDLTKVVPAKEVSEIGSLYILMDLNGEISMPHNKMVATYGSKENGHEYLKRLQMSAIAQVYIPFADSTFDDVSLRITVNQDFGWYSNLPPEKVGNDLQGLAQEIFPTIKAVDREVTVAPDGRVDLKFKVSPKRRGVKIYLKSDAGYVARREVVTNGNGEVTVPVTALCLEKGDEFDVEAGFKWFSNINRTKVKVV